MIDYKKSKTLIIYRKLLNNEIINLTLSLVNDLITDKEISNSFLNKYYDIQYLLINTINDDKIISGSIWKDFILNLMLNDENKVSLSCEKKIINSKHPLYNLFIKELSILKELYNINWDEIGGKIEDNNNILNIIYPTILRDEDYNKKIKLVNLLKNDCEISCFAKELIKYYNEVGCGDLGRYKAFKWDNGLIGIEKIDNIKIEDLIGYEHQKEILIKNTEAFVSGQRGNNVLLYGDKGTGKSSSVKAMLNKYHSKGLRMIELTKEQFLEFPKIINSISNRNYRFIVFIDDLSFEDFETEYKHFKAILEGGLQVQSENVLIYVTSNRRHLVRESWNDQNESGEEIHISDSIQEKLSLADRFGITITYLSPNQESYLKIVEELAVKNNINLSKEELKERAIKWEMKYHGRSGRTAKQFIDYLSSVS